MIETQFPTTAVRHGWATMTAALALGEHDLTTDQQIAFAHVLDCDDCLADLEGFCDGDPEPLLLLTLIPALAHDRITYPALLAITEAYLADEPLLQLEFTLQRDAAVLERLAATTPALVSIAALARSLLDAALANDRAALDALTGWSGTRGGSILLRGVIALAGDSADPRMRDAARAAAAVADGIDEAAAFDAARDMLRAHAETMVEYLGLGWRKGWSPAPSPVAQPTVLERVRGLLASLGMQANQAWMASGGSFQSAAAAGDVSYWRAEAHVANIYPLNQLNDAGRLTAEEESLGRVTIFVEQNDPHESIMLRVVPRGAVERLNAQRLIVAPARPDELRSVLAELHPAEWVSHGGVALDWPTPVAEADLAAPGRLLNDNERRLVLAALTPLSIIWA